LPGGASSPLALLCLLNSMDEIASYGIMLMHVNAYLKTKRGRLERILERIIKSYPISAKQNPYYGGAFNGNNCMRILENTISLFNQLWTAVLHGEFNQEEKRRVLGIIRKHRPIWIAFSKVAPLI
jgi:hypothetical protein